jgi:alpha-beta hydrolase superfamily lysophospholipase
VQYPAEHGYTVYAYDQRGHGRSSGKRAYAERFARFLGDLEAVVRFVRRREGSKALYLVGHSFGRQVVLSSGATRDNGVAGIIASSPNLRLAMPIHWVKKRAGLLLSRLTPSFSMSTEIDPMYVSHDLDEVAAYVSDPLVNNGITVRLASEMFSNQDKILDLAQNFKLPCLLMHGGDDHISDPDGTEDFYAACASKDKSIKIYPGLYHELFNECAADRQQVFAHMEKWLKGRV